MIPGVTIGVIKGKMAKEFSRSIAEDILNEATDSIIEVKIDEAKLTNIEKEIYKNKIEELSSIDYNLTEKELFDPKNKSMFEKIKSAEQNPETRRAFLNKLSDDFRLKGNMGEIIVSRQLNKIGEFRRSVPYEINNRKNVIDFVCEKGLDKNESFKAIKVAENGKSIVLERIYINKGKSIAVEVKNGLSEINSRKHLKEQLEAGKDMCEKSLLAINEDMANEIMKNPESYIDAINDLKKQSDEIVILMPSIEKQKAIIGGVRISEYNIY